MPVDAKDEALASAAREIARLAKSAAHQTETNRRVPQELITAISEAGLFRMCVPKSSGGLEVSPCVLVDAISTVAAGDGSTGWVTMIASTSALVSAYLDQQESDALLGARPETILGGVFAPVGKAVRDGDDYRVTGRWAFASGCEHAHWLMGGCVVDDGPTATRMFLFPADQVEIHDTWQVSGLKGTGSHDISVTDLLVPAARSVSLVDDQPREPGELYRFPVFGLLALGIAAVTTGIARHAIDEFVSLAGAKKTATGRRLVERSAVQSAVAESEAKLAAARALLHTTITEALQAGAGGGNPSRRLPTATRARVRMAANLATQLSTAVVDRMYDSAGASSIFESNALQRCFRDVHVATQHRMVSPPIWELAGRVVLGVDSDTRTL